MADITISVPVSTFQIAFDNTTTGGKIADLGGAKKIILKASADVYIGFDQPVSTSQSYKVLSSNTADTVIDVQAGTVNRLYALGVSGSGTLYIISII